MKLSLQGSCRLHPVQPYSFAFSLREVNWYPLDVTERVSDGALLRGFRLQDGRPVFTVTQETDTDALETAIYAATSVDFTEVTKAVTALLNLDLDLNDWYATVSTDDPMHRIIRSLSGFKPLAKPTIFESLVTAILEQQLNVEFACTLETRLIQRYGTKLETEEGTTWLFPTPASLANLEYKALRPLQVSGAKSRYIIDIARQITTREIHPESWRSLPDDQLMDHLLALRGVGRWTAEYVAMIGYRRYHHAPAADIGLRNAVTALTGSPEQLAEDATREYVSQWSRYRGLATVYIWHAFAIGIL